tara:strand:- start:6 stop:1148 length:1143 start_codon:yes stop_codon:yes gene_type:complete
MDIKFVIPIFKKTLLKNAHIALIDGQPLCTYVINKICEKCIPEDVIVLYEDEIIKKSIQRMEPYNKVKFLKRDSNILSKDIEEDKESNSIENSIFYNLKIFLEDLKKFSPDWLIIVDPNIPLINENTIANFLNIISETDKNNVFCCTSLNDILMIDSNKEKVNSVNAKIIFKGLSAWKFSTLNSDFNNLDFEKNIKNSELVEISNQETSKATDLESFQNIECILKGKRLNKNIPNIKYFNSDIKGIERNLISLLSKDGSGLKVKNFDFISGKVNIEKVIEEMGANSSWSYPFVINGQDQVCLIQQIKNDSCRRHHHITKAEFWVVLKGEFEWQIKNQKINVKEGEIIRLVPGETHVITCKSEEPGIRLAMGGASMEHIYV